MIEALNGGIGIIVQESGTISQISVAENIYLGELNQFSGIHYFEERRIENFSPLFKLNISDMDSITKAYIDNIYTPKNTLCQRENFRSSNIMLTYYVNYTISAHNGFM